MIKAHPTENRMARQANPTLRSPASAGGGFTCRRSAPPNSVSAAVRSRSPPGRRPATVRTLTATMRNQPLTVLLHRLNWVLRSWTTYFRHGSSWAAFDYLRLHLAAGGVLATPQAPAHQLEGVTPPLSARVVADAGCGADVQPRSGQDRSLPLLGRQDPHRGPASRRDHAHALTDMDWWSARCAATRTAGSEARVGEWTIAKHGAALRPDPYYDHRPLSGVSASAWHQVADRPAYGRFVGAVGPPPVEDRAGLGWAGGGDYESATSVLRAVLRPGDAGLLGHLLQQPPAATMVAVSEVDSAEVLCSAGQCVSSPSAGWNGVSPKGDQVERRDKTVCPVGS
jgi:Group II intron, maturase-specific domain